MKDYQSRFYSIVLEKYDQEKKNEIINNSLENALKAICDLYAFINHDKDTKDNGEPEREHIQAYIELKNRSYAKTLLKRLSYLLNINENRIGLRTRKRDDRIANIQYLIHLNDPEKHQYAPFEIITNNRELIDGILVNEITELTAKSLLEIINRHKRDKRKIMLEIGLKQYNKYFRIIQDICEKQWDYMDAKEITDKYI